MLQGLVHPCPSPWKWFMNYRQPVSSIKSGIDWRDRNQVFKPIAFLLISLSGSDCNCTIKPDAGQAMPLFDQMGADSIVGMNQLLYSTPSYVWLWSLCACFNTNLIHLSEWTNIYSNMSYLAKLYYTSWSLGCWDMIGMEVHQLGSIPTS